MLHNTVTTFVCNCIKIKLKQKKKKNCECIKKNLHLPFYKTTVSGDNSLVLPDFTIFTRPSCQKAGKTLCDWSNHFFSLSPPDPTVQLFVHYFTEKEV